MANGVEEGLPHSPARQNLHGRLSVVHPECYSRRVLQYQHEQFTLTPYGPDSMYAKLFPCIVHVFMHSFVHSLVHPEHHSLSTDSCSLCPSD